jgi:shikimate dehydrogenase
MNKLGILGWPLEKTYSPQIHKFLLDLCGLEGSYHTIKHEIINSKIISRINDDFSGYNVTIPHKEKIVSLNNTSILSDSVKAIGASNTILNKNSKTYLFNTDFSGFKTFLDLIQYDFGINSVLILGSGGSSKAIAYSLDSMNVNYYIASRGESIGTIPYSEISKISKSIGLVINTTPLGMPPYEDTSFNIDWQFFDNLETVINLGYGSANTFLDKFDKSINQYDGLGMLVCQAIESFNIWTSADLSPIRIYGEVLKELEGIDD